MQLWEELEKLYVTVKEPLFVRYLRHPSQLRMVGKAKYNISRDCEQPGPGYKLTIDRLIYRHYLD